MGGKLLYFADQLSGDPRRVKGVTNTPPTFWATTTHELPQAGGRLFAKGQMQFFDGGFGRPRFDRNTKQSEMTVNVRIPGLKQLPGEPCGAPFNNYQKARLGPDQQGCTDPFHLDVHAYGASEFTLQTIPLIAEFFFFTTSNPQNPSTGRILSVNDISLPKGGVFDLALDWEGINDHKGHRLGDDVDINRGGVNCKPDHALRLAIDQLVGPQERAGNRLTGLLCESGGRKHIDMEALPSG